MAFERETNRIKEKIGFIEIIFFVPEEITPRMPQKGTLYVEIIFSDGHSERKAIDLLARLQDDATGQTHLANLASLRDYIKTRLNSEFLPLP